MSAPVKRAAESFGIRDVEFRNRILGTAHNRGFLADGLPLPDDADYWRRRAAGGAAMLTIGGTVTAPESTWRRRMVTEAWREEAIPGMAQRARAIRAEGAVAACQLVHLGRETTGADMWFAPVAPSAVRSPREPTRARVLSETEIDGVVAGFVGSARNSARAGFQVVELHAAHGYLLAQFLSPSTNQRAGADTVDNRVAIVARIARDIRAAAPELLVGIRVSTDGEAEGGFSLDQLCELLPVVSPLFDYVHITVGVRSTYVRDMATSTPPLLEDVERLRQATEAPLVVAQSFRTAESIEAALAAGADFVGVARPLIADPDMPAKILAGRAETVRPCVSCNEDCRTFDPVLLCSVNPALGPARSGPRPALPYVARGAAHPAGRVAIVGAGPAGLECAITVAGEVEVVIFDERDHLGGSLAVAAQAPNREGWRALIDYYSAAVASAANIELRLGERVTDSQLQEFDHVVLAPGSTEVLPQLPGIDRARSSSQLLALGPSSVTGAHLVVVDDGFGWWPCASAVETGISAGFTHIHVVTPGSSFVAKLPPEGMVQFLKRLRGAPVRVLPHHALQFVEDEAVVIDNVMSGERLELPADVVVVVGERQANDWNSLIPEGPAVQVIGDALVPRRVHHAISEGRAAGGAVI